MYVNREDILDLDTLPLSRKRFLKRGRGLKEERLLDIVMKGEQTVLPQIPGVSSENLRFRTCCVGLLSVVAPLPYTDDCLLRKGFCARSHHLWPRAPFGKAWWCDINGIDDFGAKVAGGRVPAADLTSIGDRRRLPCPESKAYLTYKGKGIFVGDYHPWSRPMAAKSS